VLPRPAAQAAGRAVLLSAVAERASADPDPAPLQFISTALGRLAMVPQALPALIVMLVLGGTVFAVSAAASGSATAPFSRLLGTSSSEHRIELRGVVASVGAASFTITTESGPQLITITPQTDFEGVAVLAELHPGDTVKVRATQEADGSLVAQEVEREVAAPAAPLAPTDAPVDSSGPGPGDDNSGPGDGQGDDDSSGPGNAEDRDDDEGDKDDDNSGAGDGEDDDEADDNSGPGNASDPDEAEDQDDNSGSGNSGEENDDHRGPSGSGDGEEDDNSGSGSGGSDDDHGDNSGPGGGGDEEDDD
jgi:hypothetical protein